MCGDLCSEIGAASAVSKHQTLQAFATARPQLAEDIFVAPNSSLIGDVSLGKGSSVWYGAVLRGKCLNWNVLAEQSWVAVGKLAVLVQGMSTTSRLGTTATSKTM